MRPTSVLALFGCLALLILPSPSEAQRRVESTVGVGAVRVRYGDAVDLSAITLAPTVTWTSARHLLLANAVLSQPIEGMGSSQGMVYGRWNTSATAPVVAEFAGIAGGSRTGDGAATGQLQGTVRGVWRGARRGAVIGGGGGRVWDGAIWRRSQVTEVGGYAVFGAGLLTVTHTPTVAEDTIRYADSQISFGWDVQRFSLDAVVGHRQGTERLTGIDDPGAWANLTASFHIAERQQVVISAGSYPLDLLQGFPAGRYLSLGMRFGGASRGTVREAATDRAFLADATVQVVARSTGGFVIRLLLPAASAVEIQGDFTGWLPIAMRPRGDGWWETEISAAAGVHEIVYRRDGGPWLAPPTLTPRRDEFGGTVGVLVLP